MGILLDFQVLIEKTDNKGRNECVRTVLYRKLRKLSLTVESCCDVTPYRWR